MGSHCLGTPRIEPHLLPSAGGVGWGEWWGERRSSLRVGVEREGVNVQGLNVNQIVCVYSELRGLQYVGPQCLGTFSNLHPYQRVNNNDLHLSGVFVISFVVSSNDDVCTAVHGAGRVWAGSVGKGGGSHVRSRGEGVHGSA